MFPTVSAVITTCGRPELLRVAVQSIFEQDYTGHIEVVVVYDRIPVDALSDLSVPENRSLHTITNVRSAGLAGGRNTGILAASGELVGFCDDDDAWLASKLTEQVGLWQSRPEASAVSAGILVRTGGQDIARLAPASASFSDFLLSRITEIHPSAMLYRRADLILAEDATYGIGLVDEDLPAGYGEDYDLLLRASRHAPIVAVSTPLVRVLWDRPSFFAGKWRNMAAGLTYLLQKFPEFESCPRGLARISGQIAFAHAAVGERALAYAYARATLRRNPRQLRAWAALFVAGGLIKGETLVNLVQKTGRGL